MSQCDPSCGIRRRVQQTPESLTTAAHARRHSLPASGSLPTTRLLGAHLPHHPCYRPPQPRGETRAAQGKHFVLASRELSWIMDHFSWGGAGHSGPTGGSTADLGTQCNGSGHFFHFRIDGDPNCPVVSSQRLVWLCLLSMVYGQASSRVSANAAAVHPQTTSLCKGCWLLRGEEHEPWHSPRPPFSLNRSRNPDRQPFFNKSTND